MRGRPRVVVFCDLDSLQAAPPPPAPPGSVASLEGLEQTGVAVVLCSRRTRAEIDWFAQQLQIETPFVAEHGAAVFIPRGYFADVPGSRPVAGYDVVEFGRSYASVVDLLRRAAMRAQVPIRSMADMSIEEASHKLGVPLPLGRLAKLREYTELFQVDDADRPRLFRALRAAHLHCIEGDRLDQVGATVDASLGAALLRTLYRRAAADVVTVGVADATAEPDVLRLVDHPIVVSAGAARLLAFPASLTDRRGADSAADPAALAVTVNLIVAAIKRVNPAAAVVNERSV